MAEQPSLELKSIIIPGEASVFADHPVTGDDDWERIHPIGMADGAECIVVINDLGDISIGAGAAVRNEFYHFPDFLVESRGITKINAQVKFLSLARKILAAGGAGARESVPDVPWSATCSVQRVPSQKRCSWRPPGSGYQPGAILLSVSDMVPSSV